MKKISVLLVLLITCIINSHALTLSQIETQVRRLIRDTSSDTSRQRYSDTILTDVINETQRDVISQTWPLEISYAWSLTAGTTYYSLPTDLIAIKAATFRSVAGVTSTLSETSIKVMTQQNADFERSSKGQPMNYFIRYSTSGADALEIGLNPVPQTTSTGTVKLDYYKQATDLSGSSDVPFDGNYHLVPYHSMLVYGTAYKIKLMEGKVEEAQALSAMFSNTLSVMMERYRQMPNYTPSMTAVSK